MNGSCKNWPLTTEKEGYRCDSNTPRGQVRDSPVIFCEEFSIHFFSADLTCLAGLTATKGKLVHLRMVVNFLFRRQKLLAILTQSYSQLQSMPGNPIQITCVKLKQECMASDTF